MLTHDTPTLLQSERFHSNTLTITTTTASPCATSCYNPTTAPCSLKKKRKPACYMVLTLSFCFVARYTNAAKEAEEELLLLLLMMMMTVTLPENDSYRCHREPKDFHALK